MAVQLFETQVGTREMTSTLPREGRLDQCLQHIDRARLSTVAERELLRAREFLDRLHQPKKELPVRFEGGAGTAGRAIAFDAGV